MRLSEQYVKALFEVYEKANIVTMPEQVEGELRSGNPSATTIATAFALYKQVAGSSSVIPTPEQFEKMSNDREMIGKLLEKTQQASQGS